MLTRPTPAPEASTTPRSTTVRCADSPPGSHRMPTQRFPSRTLSLAPALNQPVLSQASYPYFFLGETAKPTLPLSVKSKSVPTTTPFRVFAARDETFVPSLCPFTASLAAVLELANALAAPRRAVPGFPRGC